MFEIIESALETAIARSGKIESEAGGVVIFEGRVRDVNDGKAVLHLEYSAYKALADKEGQRIVEEARVRFGVLSAVCFHRVGSLEIGELAVWIRTTARHRHPAFEACEYIISQVKKRVPIWKKEYYADGTTDWVFCDHPDGSQEGRHEGHSHD